MAYFDLGKGEGLDAQGHDAAAQELCMQRDDQITEAQERQGIKSPPAGEVLRAEALAAGARLACLTASQSE